MKLLIGVLVVTASVAWAKDTVDVEVKAIHSVTHEDQGRRSVLDKGIMGTHAPTRQVESFNLDTVIKGERVLLACDDPKGCEAPALGAYKGELRRSKWIKLTFGLPLAHKEVSRWYKIAGSW
jgi:hypothetical protein